MQLYRPLFLTTLLLTSSCGGGGGGGGSPIVDNGGDDTGVGGSGQVVGPLQGIGSIIINERTLNTDDASFTIEGSVGALSDLQEGQRLTVTADLTNNTASEVTYRSNVIGPATTVNIIDPLSGSAQLVVLGQQVLTNAQTRLANTSFDLLAVGQVLEVSGVLNADGILVASFIELLNDDDFSVSGTIAAVDDITMTLQIDGLTVDFSNANLIGFAGTPVEGQLVAVDIADSSFIAPSQASATTVELLEAFTLTSGEEVELEGFITDFSSASAFEVNGIPVITNAATEFEDGAASSLGLNVQVEVEGEVNSSGTLVAESVEIESTEAVRSESTISMVDEVSQSITTDVGLTFEIRQLTELEDETGTADPLTLADLQSGDYLEIRGFLEGDTIVAAEVEREAFDEEASLRGPLTGFDSSSGTFEILGVTITTSLDTLFDDDDDVEIGQAQFESLIEIGTFVEAEWDPFTDTTLPVDRLSIEQDDD